MNQLKSIRKSLKITQKELSKSVNVSQGLISLYEQGKVYPSVLTASMIFKVLHKKDKSISFQQLWGLSL